MQILADFGIGIRLKKEAKTSLQAYKDQSLLRRRFGDDAVRLYGSIGSAKPASQIISELGITEERFIEIVEFMNNNAMVSVLDDSVPQGGIQPSSDTEDEGKGGQGAEPEEEPSEGGEASKEEGEAPSKDEEDKGEEGKEEDAAGENDDEEAPSKPRREAPKNSPDTLSPLEKVIHDKYGDIGVQVYNLIDGEKTAEEILRQTGVSEAKLVEILEFMDEQGVIKLEKPPEKEDKGESEEKPAPEPAQEPRFKPITEEEPEETPFMPPKAQKKDEQKKEAAKAPEPEIAEDIILVDVPLMGRLSLMQKAMMYAELSTKFPKGARQLLDLVDGNRDFIDLALATGLSFFDIDAILAYFGKKGFISFRQLAREEIKKKYGEDGFAIYKRFGREGLLLYEMIGKEASLRDIILKSRFDPDRAIDILVFIHKVLGLDVPIDRNIIYRQLGLRK